MLLQKTFHVHQNPDETAARLADLSGYVRELAAFRKGSIDENGNGHFEFMSGGGFRGHCEVAPLSSGDPNQILFCSKSGNLDVSGLVEFLPIREGLTEVRITLDYTIHSKFHRVLDAITGSMDHFVNVQLEILNAHCEGGRKTEAARRFPSAIIFPAAAQLAH